MSMSLQATTLTEKIGILSWTALLVVCPKPLFILNAIDCGTLVILFGIVTGILIIVSRGLQAKLLHIEGDRDANKTLKLLRRAVTVMLPLFCVMLIIHPMSAQVMCVARKMVALEGAMWKRWCPEAYIVLVSLFSILVVARRAYAPTIDENPLGAFLNPKPAASRIQFSEQEAKVEDQLT